MQRYSLDGTWTLYCFPERDSPVRGPADLANHAEAVLPAQVPGNVELDLHRAGITADPFFGDAIHALRPYELYEWWYQKAFTPPGDAVGQRTELVLHGADCIATYWLNGEGIGRSDNALIEHRFDVTDRLRPDQPNTLIVRLASPVLEALRHRYDPSLETWGFGEEKVWARKPAQSYGWYIMPRALSAGLWRSVELVVHRQHEITDVYVSTRSVSTERASLGLYFEATTAPERLLDPSLRVTVACGESRFDVTRRVRYCAGTITFDTSDPRLWWSAGYGDAPGTGADLYDATVQLCAGEEILAEHLWPWQNNDQWITHATAPAGRDDDRQYRVALMANQIRELFGTVPDDLETFILASQISQAEAKKAFIEMTRLRKRRRTGVIWWNLMDGWPQFSDAVVDYHFGKKLAYPYVKRAQLPICLMIDEPRDWHVRLAVGNDTRHHAEGIYSR